MSPGSAPPPPPGWYPDPVRPGTHWRWWDGERWTTGATPPSGTAPSGTAPPGTAPPGTRPPVAWPSPDPVRPPAVPPPGPGGQAPPGDEARPARQIPVRAVWWALLGLVVGEIVGSGLAGAAVSLTGNSSSAGVTLAGEIGLWGGMLWSCVLVSRRYGTSSLRRDFGLAIRVRDLGPGVLVAVLGTALSVASSAVFSGTRLGGTNTQIIAGQRHNDVGAVIVTLVVALGAPIFEELFFRGLLRSALTTAFGSGRAVVAQGVLFGLAHYQPSNGLGNVSVIVTIALLGILLGYVATRTGRLGAGMIGHSLFNLTATVLVLSS